MPNWSKDENKAIVKFYFAMLNNELDGVEYNNAKMIELVDKSHIENL